ncbi:MAG: PHP domain-containing protein [Deltaproteobacteria bacterium]|nr:PHP domain-containing protein [Deltaproteobacteria bacterium]
MLRGYRCDLHIHTCLSPCADLDMSPSALVDKAVLEKLDVIAVCDHNASENVEYVLLAAADKPVFVFPGMEITSREEVHILALFESTKTLKNIQHIVYRSLKGTNREEIFGCQPIVNEMNEVEGFNDRLLLGATDLSLQEIVESIHKLNGVAIAAHVDRESFGIIGQLGFIPPDLGLDAIEISTAGRKQNIEISGYPVITSSDAHFIDEIGGGVTTIYMETPSISELKLAMSGESGRYIG